MQASIVQAMKKKANVTLLIPVNRPATIGESPKTVASCSRDPSTTMLRVTTPTMTP